MPFSVLAVKPLAGDPRVDSLSHSDCCLSPWGLLTGRTHTLPFPRARSGTSPLFRCTGAASGGGIQHTWATPDVPYCTSPCPPLFVCERFQYVHTLACFSLPPQGPSFLSLYSALGVEAILLTAVSHCSVTLYLIEDIFHSRGLAALKRHCRASRWLRPKFC